MQFSIEPMEIKIINEIFSKIIYIVRTYDAKPIRDYIKLRIWGDINATIIYPIEIARKPMPVMTFRENNGLNDKITIVTKV